MMITIAILCAAVAFLFWRLRSMSRKFGKLEYQVETYSHVLDQIKAANKARDGLNDPDNRNRVREKYTRR